MRPEHGSRGHAPWLGELESALERSGAQGIEAVRYLRDHGTVVQARSQSAGARWTVTRGIEINPMYIRDSKISSYTLSLVIHEIRHLQQGPLTALSVYGELDAWQVQFVYLRGQLVPVPGTASQRELIEQLLALPLGWDRDVLSTARRLMRDYAGRAYRIDLLPLYPIQRELAYIAGRRVPTS